MALFSFFDTERPVFTSHLYFALIRLSTVKQERKKRKRDRGIKERRKRKIFMNLISKEWWYFKEWKFELHISFNLLKFKFYTMHVQTEDSYIKIEQRGKIIIQTEG